MIPSKLAVWPSLVLILTATACTGDESSDPIDPNARTYYEDVAPIVAESCYTCHREGGAGPFVLETYEDVEPLADLVEHVTTERSMPPWLADDSGDCQKFQDSSWLSDDDIEVIQEWVADGKHEGDNTSMPEFVDRSEHLVDATHTLQAREAYFPIENEGDDYHCFLLDPQIDTKKFLTAFEVVPGDPKIVHHVIVYSPMDDEAVQEAYELDAAEPGIDGYTCFGGPEVDAYVAAAWAPGRAMWEYPEGTGVPIEPGRPQIVQVHYNLTEGLAPDQSAVKLKLQDSVEQELLPWFFANVDMVLQPGLDKAIAKFEMSARVYMEEGYEEPQWAVPMNIIGIAPHMHLLGKDEHVELTKADGSATECLLDVPRWDFNWQFAYFYEEPIRLEPDDLLRMECNFDTRMVDEVVEWGDGTSDEMCLTLMFVTFDGGTIPE